MEGEGIQEYTSSAASGFQEAAHQDILNRMTLASEVKESVRTAIALFVYVTGIASLRSRLIKSREPLVRVILIHHIKDAHKFERMIEFVARKYHPISFDDFKDGRFSREKINILLTMDDGYESWFTKGLPILEKYSVPALFFIPSGFIACANDKEAIARFCDHNLKLSWTSPPMTPEMLRACIEHPLITIGGHTCSHVSLTRVSESDALSEIENDKKGLEDMLKGRLEAFAYPFGNQDESVQELVKRAGYGYAMTTRSDFCRVKANLCAIPRSNHGTVTPFMLSVWIIGAYDIVETLEQRIRGVGRDGYRPGKTGL